MKFHDIDENMAKSHTHFKLGNYPWNDKQSEWEIWGRYETVKARDEAFKNLKDKSERSWGRILPSYKPREFRINPNDQDQEKQNED